MRIAALIFLLLLGGCKNRDVFDILNPDNRRATTQRNYAVAPTTKSAWRLVMAEAKIAEFQGLNHAQPNTMEPRA